VLTSGTGGVSIFTLQLAKAAGARVIITSSSDEKLARTRSMGADETINYKTTPDWDKAAVQLTGGRGADHVMELGGAETYQKSLHAVAAGGHIHQIGILSGRNLQPSLFGLLLRNATIHGLYVGSVEMFKRMNSFMTNHRIHPVIDRVFEFERAPEAYELMSRGGHFGKIVIRV
jgi:NADPH:quinone reductase-like Zn-dependent oxidoreductase